MSNDSITEDGCNEKSEGHEDREESEGRVRRRVAGEPPLPLLRSKADVEGFNDVAGLFRATAEGETGHAHGHLDYLKASAIRPPACRSARPRNLKAAIAGETHEYTDMYPGMAKKARDEGFDEIAEWFETLAKAEKSHAGRFQKALDTL